MCRALLLHLVTAGGLEAQSLGCLGFSEGVNHSSALLLKDGPCVGEPRDRYHHFHSATD